MKLADQFGSLPSGTLAIRVERKGIVVLEEGYNMVVDLAKRIQSRAIAGESGWNISKVAFGSNGAPTAAGDTGISNAVVVPVGAITHPTDYSVSFAFELGPSAGVGLSIREFGLLASNGTLFSRKYRLGDPIEKDSETTISGVWTIQY